jgi:choline dehydrogenase-like flavoprotein
VVVLESGGLERHDATRGLTTTISGGRPYRDVDASRVRAFGGTTHIWGGWARPLDDADFDERDWVPHSGWPFRRAHLDPYYVRAHRLWRLGAYDYAVDRGRHGEPAAGRAERHPEVEDVVFQIAPTRFGAEYVGHLRAAPNVAVLLHASALDVALHTDARAARGVRVATIAGNRFAVSARFVVLAAGGLENPRLLLASGGPSGLGNAYDQVGRYFADHLHVPVGTLTPVTLAAGRRYQARRRGRVAFRTGLSPTVQARRRGRLLGCAVTLHNAADPHDVLSPGRVHGGYQSLSVLSHALRRGRIPDGFGAHIRAVVRHADEALALSYRRLRPPPPARMTIGIRAEQSPNPASRVRLDESVDPLGARRVRIEWRLTDQDFSSIAAAQQLFARAFAPEHPDMLPEDGPDGWAHRVAPGAHHLGTTRMHHDPRSGVVDANCRVHGTANVYVAGSSVFPTGGWAPPTLTIIALAIRLADHLERRLQ